MPNTAKNRNRLHDLYEESPEDGAQDYVQLRRRILELSLASARAMQAIDTLLARLQVSSGGGRQHMTGKLAHP